jgi:short-subunit dehydrogenase
MKKFKDQVVFITGASAGIGAALATEFSFQGANLAITARRLDRLNQLASQLTQQGSQALPLLCDVTKDGDLEKAVQATVQKLGKINVVVANAGFGVVGNVEKLTLEDYRRQFETNIFGVLRTLYASLDELKKSKGTFVILGSVAGYISLPGSSPYAMSKFAIHAFANSLTHELRPYGVSVVLIVPGFVESEIRQIDNHGKLQVQAKDPIHARLVMPTHKAAQLMISAIAARRAEVIITRHGKAFVWIQRHLPWVFYQAAKLGLGGRGQPKKEVHS